MKQHRRALLSVTDKTGLTELATLLAEHEYELVATGGTATHLRRSGLPVREVSDLTGFPEIFGGRVKSLHPVIFGGILGPSDADFASVTELQLAPIDIVCVNLYRFAEAVQRAEDEAGIIEHIDIGGPALLRAAAKNHQRVTVLADPRCYEEFAAEIRAGDGSTTARFRRRMAQLAFASVAAYDRAIGAWLQTISGEPAAFDEGTARESPPVGQEETGGLVLPLRYGENPHQSAELEVPAGSPGDDPLAAVGLELLGGKQLSYNNLIDVIAAVKLVGDFPEPCCAVIKHTNPCGFGLGSAAQALTRALSGDPVSAFGGVFAFNGHVDAEAAAALHARFLEIVAAPKFDPDALAQLGRKKSVRLVRTRADLFQAATNGQSRRFGRITLRQQEDSGFPELSSWRLAAGNPPTDEQVIALSLAWRICKHVKSNAIVLANNVQLLGVGAGQMSRVDSVRLAIRKAGDQQLNLGGAVAASDGFFPFPDGITVLHEAGIHAVAAPGGSIRDQEVAAAADRLGLTLLFLDRRHFRH